MLTLRTFARTLAACVLMAAAITAHADELRNVKRGAPVPSCKLPSIEGQVVESEAMKGNVVVYVCLSAEQKRSELAAIESDQVVGALAGEPVKLVHITADVVQKAYFEKLRADNKMTSQLVFDADREFYNKLGLIAFPTTIVVDKQGNLSNVISLHGRDYKNTLDGYVQYALGKLTEKALAERLAAKASENGSPRSAASAHRALAHLMREKRQYDTATAELEKGLALDPDNLEIMLDLADVAFLTEKYDGAETMLTKVLQAQPEHRRAMQLHGACLFRMGKVAEAEGVLESALPLNPSPQIVHYYLGLIAESKGEKDKALEHYREALKRFVEPGSPEAK